MKKIQRLRLVNFQSHPDTTVHFHPGINSIVGSSDAGKSSLLRSIYWALTNKPDGDWMISHWAKDSAVELDTEDAKIIRTKGTENLYYLDGQKLSAFGREVPSVIKAVADLDSINISRQFDPPFLISMPASQVSEYLNDIIGLSKMDEVVEALAQLKRNASSAVKSHQKRIEELTATLGDDSRLRRVEEMVREKEDLDAYRDSIEKYEESLGALLGRLEVLDGLPSVDLETYERLKEESENVGDIVDILDRYCDRIVRLDKEVAELSEKLTKAEAKAKVCSECGKAL